MVDHAKLLNKLRQATEGSDELDREIAKECNIQWSSDEDGNYGPYDILPRRCRFTRSEEVALTLVSKGYHIEMSGEQGASNWAVRLTSNKLKDVIGLAPTLALAICIAVFEALWKEEMKDG